MYRVIAHRTMIEGPRTDTVSTHATEAEAKAVVERIESASYSQKARELKRPKLEVVHEPGQAAEPQTPKRRRVKK